MYQYNQANFCICNITQLRKRLPVETDEITKPLREYLGENSLESTLDFENKKLRRLDFSGEKLSDFDVGTYYNSVPKGRLQIASFVCVWEDGSSTGFAGGGYTANFKPGGKHIAGSHANAYITDDGEVYIYGRPVVNMWDYAPYPTPVKVIGIKDIIDVIPGANGSGRGGYALDKHGNVSIIRYSQNQTAYAEPYPEHKVRHIGLTDGRDDELFILKDINYFAPYTFGIFWLVVLNRRQPYFVRRTKICSKVHKFKVKRIFR